MKKQRYCPMCGAAVELVEQPDLLECPECDWHGSREGTVGRKAGRSLQRLQDLVGDLDEQLVALRDDLDLQHPRHCPDCAHECEWQRDDIYACLGCDWMGDQRKTMGRKAAAAVVLQQSLAQEADMKLHRVQQKLAEVERQAAKERAEHLEQRRVMLARVERYERTLEQAHLNWADTAEWARIGKKLQALAIRLFQHMEQGGDERAEGELYEATFPAGRSYADYRRAVLKALKEDPK